MSGPDRAYWLRAPGSGEIRPVVLGAPGPGEVRVRTVRSGVSRGTEALVHRGGVPPDQYAVMRAPFQAGDFPGPVKYGYLSVGVVEEGPHDLRGRRVFCLHPHQTAYVVPVDAVVPVPDEVPEDRAVLAGTVETAVNALWDATPLVGERVVVVGAGMVGLCIARLLVGIPGAEVTVVDLDPRREPVAQALGADFSLPPDAPRDRDLVVHASATGAGLQLSLDLLAAGGSVLDVSWYGDTEVGLRLGGAFHARRLSIRASQVGSVSPRRRPGRTTHERLRLAMELLRDPAFDAIITGSSSFDDLPEVMPRIASGALPTLCHTITYPTAVALLPSVDRPWPQGQRFYDFDRVYGTHDLGYAGPRFGFSKVPDQFALSEFGRRELTPSRRAPVVAQIELTSSHGPWAPLPTRVDPTDLGDGSVYDDMAARAVGPAQLLRHREDVPAAYRQSIAYSLTSVLDLLRAHDDEDLVVVLLGDHQPASVVSGHGGNRDVPVSVVARDRTVVDRIAAWGWTPGLVPDRGAPVWPMADFRDRFLTSQSTR